MLLTKNISLKRTLFGLSLAMLTGFLWILLAIPSPASAAAPATIPDSHPTPVECNHKDPNSSELNKCLKQNPIVNDIKTIVNVLSAGVGVVITGVIIVGSIQYIVAGNNPNSVSAAKQRITNALIALLAFIFIYAFLDWLLPGDSFFTKIL